MAFKLSVDRTAYFLTFAGVLSYLFSIAVGNILIGLAIAALLFSGEKMRFPPVWMPLVAFCAGTVISMALSPDPWSGRPQIRKFLLYFAIPLLVYSTVRTADRVKALLLAMTGVMTLSALWSFVQFAQKLSDARDSGKSFYDFYTSERITGFMSHWMTLGGQEMMILLVAIALLFWAAGAVWKPWLAAAVVVIGLSLVMGYTRSIWFGAFCGAVYLMWHWKRWWLLAIPIPIVLVLLLNPFGVRDRAVSAFRPHGDTDSNEFRYVCRRAGFEMIKAHPWFGVGPEQIKEALNKGEFGKWVPPDIPRPLPTGWYGHLHNIYIHFAAERGIPTMLALMWFLGKILFDFARGAGRRDYPPDIRGILRGGVAMMIGMLIVGFYEVNIGDSEVLTVFLAIAACGYVILDVCRGDYPPSSSSAKPSV